jgi:hypothetical protein
MDTPKRNQPIQVALTGDDLALIDGHIESVVFNVSRSEIGCVAVRLMLDKIRRGEWSLEDLFKKYLKQPLQELSPYEVMEIAEDIALRVEQMVEMKLTPQEADELARRIGRQQLKRWGWVDAFEEGEMDERRRA